MRLNIFGIENLFGSGIGAVYARIGDILWFCWGFWVNKLIPVEYFTLPMTIEIYLVNLLPSRFIVAYFIMPETENRTLEEIEMHFSDNSKGLTDIRIKEIKSVS